MHPNQEVTKIKIKGKPYCGIQEGTLLTGWDNFERIEHISKTGSFIWNLSEDTLSCSQNFFYLVDLKFVDGRLNKDDFFQLIDRDSQNFVLDVMHNCIVTNDEFEITFNLAGTHKKIRLFGYPEGSIDSKAIIGVIQDISETIEASQALITGQDAERKRISLEIHDSVGQKLIAAKYQLALVKFNPNEEMFQKLNDQMNQIIGEIRTITHNLSSQVVVEVGLRNAIGQLVNDTATYLRAKKEYKYEIKDAYNKDLELKEEAANMIYRIVQESLSNATKYSQADRIGVRLNILNNQINITIEDNGVGIADENQSKLKKGIGLRNIKERVACLSGFIRIQSAPNQGVKIIIKIPLKNAIAM